MSATPLINVIVPIYNVEQYLRKCVDSLLRQTFQSYTIILVDDGSPDACPMICDEYHEKYPEKVSVIHKKNGGLSDARNVGVSAANAQFVVFVDSDDYVSDNYLESLYQPHVQYGADIVVTRMCREYVREDGSVYRENPEQQALCVLEHDSALEELFYEKRIAAFAWGKLIPRSLALKYPYPVGKYFEDSFTTYKQFCACSKIVIAPEVTYYYLQRNGSIQRRAFEKKHMDLFYSVLEMEKFLTDKHMTAEVQTAMSYRFCRACYVTLRHAVQLDKKAYSEVCKTIIPEYKKHIMKTLKSDCSLKEKMLYLLIICSGNMFRRLIMIVEK